MGAVFGIFATCLLFIFWGGYVTSILWGWFVVPLGVMAITYWHAVGLSCVVAAFIGVRSDNDKDESLAESAWKSAYMNAAMPAVMLAIGWFAKSQMS